MIPLIYATDRQFYLQRDYIPVMCLLSLPFAEASSDINTNVNNYWSVQFCCQWTHEHGTYYLQYFIQQSYVMLVQASAESSPVPALI